MTSVCSPAAELFYSPFGPRFSGTFIDEIQTLSGEKQVFNNIDGTRRGVSGTTSESILSLRESRKKFRVKRDWGLLYIVSA